MRDPRPPVPAALHHTCFVVRDVEATARRLSASLGVGPWTVRTMRPTLHRVRGVDVPFSFRVAVAAVGGGHLELASPHSGASLLDEQLARHGEGFGHVCLTYETAEALRAATAALVAQGREPLQEAAGDGFAFAYFALPEIASVVEVLHLDEARLPPPDATL